MGNPHRYYKRFLQKFAYNLAVEKNEKLANEMYENDSEEELEQFVLDEKVNMDEKQFYFNAGIAYSTVIYDVWNNDCTDGLNACIGGFTEFEYFIGLRDDEEEEDD